MSGREGSEGYDEPEKVERSGVDLEDLRKEILEDYGPEGVDPKPGDISKECTDEDERGPTEAGEKDDQHGESAGPKVDAADKADGAPEAASESDERTSDEDLERFRQQVVEQYGPGGLGEDTPENQLYNMAVEERAETAATEESVREAQADPVETEPKDDKEALESSAEASKTASTGPEVHNVNDKLVVVTAQEGPEGPMASQAPDLETWDFHHFPTSQSSNLGTESSDLVRDQFTVPAATHEQMTRDGALPAASISNGVQLRDTDMASTQVGDVGREIVSSGSEVVLVRPNRGNETDSRESLERQAESERSVESLAATGYGHTSALLVPDRMIPEHEERSDVFEVAIARKSQPEKEYNLYFTHKPGYDRAYVNLFHLDAERGEEFLVKPPERYSRSDFAEEYNGSRPSGLDNTRLIEREGGIYLKVGDSELRFTESKLRTYQGQVVLDGVIEGKSEVKIAKSQDGFDFRLKDHSRVTEIRSDSGIVLSYHRTDHDEYPHRRMMSDSERPGPTNLARERLTTGEIRAIPESEGNPRALRLLVSEDRRETVSELLSNLTPDEYRKTKGDIAEEIVRDLLPKLGVTLVADHPFNDNPLKTRSERTGPDLLAKPSDSEALCYVEVKWWGSVREALERGESQVRSDLRRYRTFDEREVNEGYVAVLDWSPIRNGVFLRLKKVPLRGEEALK